MKNQAKIRIFVDNRLKEGLDVQIAEEASHYLCNVMRLKNGDKIICFNGTDGEFVAEIVNANKKQTTLKIIKLLRQPKPMPDIWLLFAPLKKDRTDFLIEKAVELGAARLVPVITDYAITDKIRADRIQAQIIEAAEQCERLDIPELAPAIKLETLLNNWDCRRKLYFMDERGQGRPCADAFEPQGSAALLIGPEGGFSDKEADILYKSKFVKPVSLGPRILRAETAAAAALAVWQAVAGDWKE